MLINKFTELFELIKEIIFILSKKKKQQAVFVFFSMAACSLLELLGVSLVFPFMQIVLNSSNMREIAFARVINDIFAINTQNGIIVFIAAAFSLVFILKNGLMMYCIYLQNRYATDFNRETSTKLLYAFMRKPYMYFINTNSSTILRSVENDVEGSYQVLINLLNAINECITVLVLGIYLLLTDWLMAVLTILLATIGFISIIAGFKPIMKRAGITYREAAEEKKRYCYQAIMGIKEISVLGRRGVFLRQYENAAIKEAKAKTVYGYLSSWPDRVLEGICISGFMVIVAFRIILYGKPEEFIPVLGLFAMGAFKILPSFSKISSRVNSIIFYSPSVKSCFNVIREFEKNGSKWSSGYEEEYWLMSNCNNVIKEFKSSIRVCDVIWKYADGLEPVLNKVSLEIKKGESIGLIGPSGGGKTTLADVVMGLLVPQDGYIEIDSKKINSSTELQGLVGYVSQTIFLIDDTIAHNVAFGVSEEEIDYSRIWRALKQSQIEQFVKSSEAGLDTIVGEDGIKLSGGQKQRIAIARALYNEPEILIFDEATSALDNETESAVMDAIDLLQGIKTMIIIAHRLSTIRKCDRIFEISNGSLREVDREEVLR